MKKYFISVFIPYLLLHLSGCYSMQKITKDEFSPAPEYPELSVKTTDKEYSFQEGNYIFINDTIYGKCEVRLLENPFQSFEGTISLNDVENIQMNKSDNNSEVPELLVKTKDIEFIFKSEINSYSVRDDTIYGIGKFRLRNFDEPFESKVSININETKEIQINEFNLGSTLALTSVIALSIVCIVAIAGGVSDSISNFFTGSK